MGTIHLKQDLNFKKPIYVGDEIQLIIEVQEIEEGKNRVRLQTTCKNQNGETVIDGEAWVLPPK